MATLRHFNISDDDKWNELLKTVFSADTNPMIWYLWESRDLYFHNSLEEKLEDLRHADVWLNTYIFVWEGKKKTDVFELTEEDVTRILNLFNN